MKHFSFPTHPFSKKMAILALTEQRILQASIDLIENEKANKFPVNFNFPDLATLPFYAEAKRSVLVTQILSRDRGSLIEALHAKLANFPAQLPVERINNFLMFIKERSCAFQDHSFSDVATIWAQEENRSEADMLGMLFHLNRQYWRSFGGTEEEFSRLKMADHKVKTFIHCFQRIPTGLQ